MFTNPYEILSSELAVMRLQAVAIIELALSMGMPMRRASMVEWDNATVNQQPVVQRKWVYIST